jgi:hypothetical protein
MAQRTDLAAFLREEPWDSMDFKTPEAALKADGMSRAIERTMLSWLTGRFYRGEGEIVELGTFIGASSISLASGLSLNPLPRGEKSKRIHAFDRFKGAFEAKAIATRPHIKLDEDGGFLSVYTNNVRPFAEFISVERCDLADAKWNGKPIEILYVDAMKSPNVSANIVRQFFPYLIPGRSVVIMQDYLFPSLPYSAVIMECLADFFNFAGDTGRENVLFVPTRPTTDRMITSFTWHGLSEEQRLHYLMQALPKQRTFRQKQIIAHQISEFIVGKYR